MAELRSENVKVVTADPSAIGLFGLAMVTLVASSEKLGLTTGLSLVIPWAIVLGGLAQLFASVNDSKRNNTFGTTAFGAYAFFWIGMGFSWMIQMGVFGKAFAANIDPKQFGFVFLGYLIFTIFMTIGALETDKVLFSIFFFINFLFLGLALNSFGIMSGFAYNLAAYSELIIALLSFYGAGAERIKCTFRQSVFTSRKAIWHRENGRGYFAPKLLASTIQTTAK